MRISARSADQKKMRTSTGRTPSLRKGDPAINMIIYLISTLQTIVLTLDLGLA
jgi:hypothetical protein